MSRIASSVYNKWPRLKAIFGIRARLVLLALILVAPAMFERVRGLETTRANRIAAASADLMEVAHNGIESQRAMLRSVEALLRATAHFHTTTANREQPCALIHSGFRLDPEQVASTSVADARGRIICSTLPAAVGIDISDRSYFRRAIETKQLVASDYIIARALARPSIIVALPVATAGPEVDHVILASVGLNWFDRLLVSGKSRLLPTVILLSETGTVLARRMVSGANTNAIPADTALAGAIGAEETGFVSTAGRGGGQGTMLYAYARVPGTTARLVVGISEAEVVGPINREIWTSYLEFSFFSLIVLFGAWVVSERLVIRPIRLLASVAQRFGRGDLAARAKQPGLPVEFDALAKSFDAMAAQLGEREGELRATNSRLTVLATLDPVSGLANRRGFESRVDFEWMRATQTQQSLAILMIDVDHFKQFNDSYGHPEGDACLSRLGGLLAEFAGTCSGFAARYGGEEFLLLLPDADLKQAIETAERLRAAVAALAIPHRASVFGCVTVSIGVAAAVPEPQLQVQDLIEAADTGLYAAKNRGRNQVVGHGVVLPLEADEPKSLPAGADFI
jgi:diguanylate cyclase (GGDEF)-like protein